MNTDGDVWVQLTPVTMNTALQPFCRNQLVSVQPFGYGGGMGVAVLQVEFDLTAYIRHVIEPRNINGI